MRMRMFLLSLSLFVPVSASPGCTTPGCAKCQQCAIAEQELIAALKAAQTAHLDAQLKAKAWALAKGAHEVASLAFRDAEEAHTATKDDICPLTITYSSSEDEYAQLSILHERLRSQGQVAVQAEAWMKANETNSDTARSAYDIAATAALAADHHVDTRRAREEADCAWTYEAATSSLLSDGNFESGVLGGIPASWRRYGSYGTSGLVTSEESHSGSRSIRYQGSGWQLIETEPVSLKASEQYELRFWALTSVPGLAIRSEFLAYGSDEDPSYDARDVGDPLYVYHSFTAVDTWEYFTHKITVNHDYPHVRINLGPKAQAGAVYYVDDVELILES